MKWLAKTNRMWTRDDFAAVDQVTTGEARAVYLAGQRQAADDPSPSGRTPFQLTGLSITVPCQGGTGSGGAGPVFVAYGDTDVFTLGPDGNAIASPRPAVVHQETDTCVTTYAATDPLRSAGGRVTLDGFFGWPLTGVAH